MELAVISQFPTGTPRLTPLLFVHGAWHGAWCWEERFLPYFAEKGYKSYALDLRGHGSSPINKSLRFTSIGDYTADVAQVADQIAQKEGTRPVVIGHSMGGYIAQKYLEKHAAPGVVLMASIPSIGFLPGLLRFTVHHPLQALKLHLTMNSWHLVSTLELAREALFSADMPLDQVRAYYARLQPESYIIGWEAAIFNRPRPALVRPKNTPILVLGAVNDGLFTVSEIEKTGRDYGTQAEIFPTMAHDMMLEKDWQKVADRIVGWLEENRL